MSNIEPSAKAVPVIRTIVVPANIYHAAMRANLHLMDLTVFGKLRSIASLEDIAVYAALNDCLFINGTRIATSSLSDTVSIGDGNETEFVYVFGQMAKTEEIIKLTESIVGQAYDPFPVNQPSVKAVDDRSLRNTLGENLTIHQDSTYQLKTSGSNVFVVVDHGFDKYIGPDSSKVESDKFIRNFLKHCSELYRSYEVARHPLFKTFLHSLAD